MKKTVIIMLVVILVFIWISVIPIIFTDKIAKLLMWLLFLAFFIWFVLFGLVKELLHNRKEKKLKYEKTWILKKTKIFNIGKEYVRINDDSHDYSHDYYRLESKDEDWNIYRSDNFANYHEWRTLNDMIKKHNWTIYDLRNKDAAIEQLTNDIKQLDMEYDNAWFFKQEKVRWNIACLEQFLAIAKEWPVKPYIVCNGKRVSVWDSIDVYVSPEDSELYYFDLDFTKEK